MKEIQLSDGSAFARPEEFLDFFVSCFSGNHLPENLPSRLKKRGLQVIIFKRLIKDKMRSCLVA